mmetsp:Transcript_19221/g.53180  ORF Transcript_19221/g.53180 Transcript_19221/m.53180 type:complete len:206 (+) Transcript_19221:1808-2425(+)
MKRTCRDGLFVMLGSRLIITGFLKVHCKIMWMIRVRWIALNRPLEQAQCLFPLPQGVVNEQCQLRKSSGWKRALAADQTCSSSKHPLRLMLVQDILSVSSSHLPTQPAHDPVVNEHLYIVLLDLQAMLKYSLGHDGIFLLIVQIKSVSMQRWKIVGIGTQSLTEFRFGSMLQPRPLAAEFVSKLRKTAQLEIFPQEIFCVGKVHS